MKFNKKMSVLIKICLLQGSQQNNNHYDWSSRQYTGDAEVGGSINGNICANGFYQQGHDFQTLGNDYTMNSIPQNNFSNYSISNRQSSIERSAPLPPFQSIHPSYSFSQPDNQEFVREKFNYGNFNVESQLKDMEFKNSPHELQCLTNKRFTDHQPVYQAPNVSYRQSSTSTNYNNIDLKGVSTSTGSNCMLLSRINPNNNGLGSFPENPHLSSLPLKSFNENYSLEEVRINDTNAKNPFESQKNEKIETEIEIQNMIRKAFADEIKNLQKNILENTQRIELLENSNFLLKYKFYRLQKEYSSHTCDKINYSDNFEIEKFNTDLAQQDITNKRKFEEEKIDDKSTVVSKKAKKEGPKRPYKKKLEKTEISKKAKKEGPKRPYKRKSEKTEISKKAKKDGPKRSYKRKSEKSEIPKKETKKTGAAKREEQENDSFPEEKQNKQPENDLEVGIKAKLDDAFHKIFELLLRYEFSGKGIENENNLINNIFNAVSNWISYLPPDNESLDAKFFKEMISNEKEMLNDEINRKKATFKILSLSRANDYTSKLNELIGEILKINKYFLQDICYLIEIKKDTKTFDEKSKEEKLKLLINLEMILYFLKTLLEQNIEDMAEFIRKIYKNEEINYNSDKVIDYKPNKVIDFKGILQSRMVIRRLFYVFMNNLKECKKNLEIYEILINEEFLLTKKILNKITFFRFTHRISYFDWIFSIIFHFDTEEIKHIFYTDRKSEKNITLSGIIKTNVQKMVNYDEGFLHLNSNDKILLKHLVKAYADIFARLDDSRFLNDENKKLKDYFIHQANNDSSLKVCFGNEISEAKIFDCFMNFISIKNKYSEKNIYLYVELFQSNTSSEITQ